VHARILTPNMLKYATFMLQRCAFSRLVKQNLIFGRPLMVSNYLHSVIVDNQVRKRRQSAITI